MSAPPLFVAIYQYYYNYTHIIISQKNANICAFLGDCRNYYKSLTINVLTVVLVVCYSYSTKVYPHKPRQDAGNGRAGHTPEMVGGRQRVKV